MPTATQYNEAHRGYFPELAEDYPALADPEASIREYTDEVRQVQSDSKGITGGDLHVDGKLGPATRRFIRQVLLSQEQEAPRVTLWWGFADKIGEAQLRRLVRVGLDRVIFNTNSTDKRWRWSPSRERTKRDIERCKAAGLEVGLMEWARGTVAHAKQAGERLAGLAEEVGGVDEFQRDSEGHMETDARSLARGQGRTIVEVVTSSTRAWCSRLPPGAVLSATVLYFNRPAGDALLRRPEIRKAIIQAYSILKPDNPATLRSFFQPGPLQHRAMRNYDVFKFERDIDELGIGIGLWAQDGRRIKGLPEDWPQEPWERIELAARACLSIGADEVALWAGHLIERGGYWPLAVRVIELLKRGKTRRTDAGQ